MTPVPGSPFSAELGIDSLAIDPQGSFLYAASQRSANLWIFSVNTNGSLVSVGGSPMLITSSGSQSSSVVVDPSGKYLYVITGSPVGIYGFSRNTTTGALTQLVGFPVPVNGQANRSTFNPSGKFLLVTGHGVFGLEGGLEVFSLNTTTGALSTTAASPVQVGGDPSGVVVDVSGRYVYVSNTADATISAFTIDSNSGLLAGVAGSPFPSGGSGTVNGPTGITADNAGHFVYVCNASNDVSVFAVNGSTGALSPIASSPFPDGGNGPSAILFAP
jgi:6-phosphogluconolactonase (cycloisomerase 2 family)